MQPERKWSDRIKIRQNFSCVAIDADSVTTSGVESKWGRFEEYPIPRRKVKSRVNFFANVSIAGSGCRNIRKQHLPGRHDLLFLHGRVDR